VQRLYHFRISPPHENRATPTTSLFLGGAFEEAVSYTCTHYDAGPRRILTPALYEPVAFCEQPMVRSSLCEGSMVILGCTVGGYGLIDALGDVKAPA